MTALFIYIKYYKLLIYYKYMQKSEKNHVL